MSSVIKKSLGGNVNNIGQKASYIKKTWVERLYVLHILSGISFYAEMNIEKKHV